MPTYTDFSRAFREVNVGLTQFEVGQKIGVTQSYAGQLLRGQARPSRELVDRIIREYPQKAPEEWLRVTGWNASQELPDERQEIADAVVRKLIDSGAIPDPEDPYTVFSRGHAALNRKHGRYIPVPSSHLGGDLILNSREDAERWLRAMEQLIAEGEI
jgi:transcriptional regulator with XRE-family HTH domain